MTLIFPLIIDDDLQLRQHTTDMIDLHFTLIEQEREHIGVYEDWALTVTREHQLDWLRDCEARYDNDRGFAAGIWVTEHDEASFVGIISSQIEPNGTVELSYWVAQGYSGKGIVSRTVQAVTAQLLPHPRIVQVQLVIDVDNQASRAVAERCGFQLDHIAKGHGIHQGKLVDRAIYTAQQYNWQAKNWQNGA